MAPGYITVADLKVALNDDRPAPNRYDALYAQAIQSASRQIDQYCDDQFYLDATPSARLFRPTDRQVLYTGAFGSATGVVVELDLDDDGTFETTWVAADWQAEPLTPRQGRPYVRISALGARYFPMSAARNAFYGYGYGGFGGVGPGYSGGYGDGSRNWESRRARVRVTAAWGWATVPGQVVQACQMLAIDEFKSKDLTGGAAGTAELAVSRFGGNRFSGLSGLNPQAAALLSGLRDTVLA